MSTVLGIITARGGSKRVPQKNIREFLGKPLLAWSIEVGKESGVFDRFILTTESPEIADIGRRYGIEVPFMRPAEYAKDTSTSFEAVKHAYEWMRDHEGLEADSIILLEPPAPGRRPFHIREAAKLIEREDIDSVLSVTELSTQYHPEKVLRMDEGRRVTRYPGGTLIRESFKRGQEYSTLYYPNAALYAFKPGNFYRDPPSLWGDVVLGYAMDSKYAFDIDTPDDWNIAEFKMRALLEEGKGG